VVAKLEANYTSTPYTKFEPRKTITRRKKAYHIRSILCSVIL